MTESSVRRRLIGAALYAGQCVSCHVDDGKGFAPYLPPLAGNPTVLDSDSSSLINIVLNGSYPMVVKGTPDAYRMPQFRQQFSDQDIADILTFIRDGWGNSGRIHTELSWGRCFGAYAQLGRDAE